jgi:hypothetical protein
MTDWQNDAPRMAAALQTAARFLIDARERAEASEARIRRAALQQGFTIDTRADYAAGSAAAYAIACSVVAGALQGGVSIDDVAGEWERERGIARPVLPDGIIPPDDALGETGS